MLWMALATFPLMAALQLICARIGSRHVVLAAAIRALSAPFIYIACLLLLDGPTSSTSPRSLGDGRRHAHAHGVPPLVSGAAGLLIFSPRSTTYASFAQY